MNTNLGSPFTEVLNIAAACFAALVAILFLNERRTTSKSIKNWQLIVLGICLFPLYQIIFLVFSPQHILGWILLFISQVLVGVGFLKVYLVEKKQTIYTENNKEPDSKTQETVALYDPITRLPNQRQFETKLRLEYQKYLREHKPIAVIAIEIDDYKVLINSHQQAGANIVVKHIAWILEKSIRDFDLVARTSSAGFHILLLRTDAQDTALIADRIRNKVEVSPALMKDQPIQMTVSIGVTIVSENSTSPLSYLAVVKSADTALLLARQKGGNRVIIS